MDVNWFAAFMHATCGDCHIDETEGAHMSLKPETLQSGHDTVEEG